MEAAVCFGISWAAAEVVVEAVNLSVVAVVLVMSGVYMVVSEGFLWGLVVVVVSDCVFFVLRTISSVVFTALSEVEL